jgi:hypothetical protein
MRKTVVGDKCRFASPVVAVRQPGKTTRRVCGDYRAINDICLLHQAPVRVIEAVKDAREVTAQFKGTKYFGKADMYKGYFQLRLDESRVGGRSGAAGYSYTGCAILPADVTVWASFGTGAVSNAGVGSLG